MLKYFINIIAIILYVNMLGQEIPDNKKMHDSIKHIKSFNLRLGFDIGNFIAGKIYKNNKISFFADSNIYKNYFLYLEYGYNSDLFNNNYYKFQTNGSYLKTGIDYNIYDNWPGTYNQISIGFYYGYSVFNGNLIKYKINQNGSSFPSPDIYANKKFNNLKGGWLEIIPKIQVQIFNNFYLGYSISFKYLLSKKKFEDYEITYVPGFYKVNSNSNFGFGMQYYISYRIKINSISEKHKLK